MIEAMPFVDAISRVVIPVVPKVDIALGPVKIEVPSPTEVGDEVNSDEEVQTEEAVVVVIYDEAPSGVVTVETGGVLVISVEPAISVIDESLHTDDVPSEITALEVIALLQSVQEESVGKVSTPEIGGELEG